MQIRAECPSRRLELTTKGGKERVRRQFFPFELIMAGSAARRAGEPFVQQFLDKHSRAGAAFVGVPLPAKPYSFVALRQHGPTFPGRAPPLLASPSPRSLISSSRHANTVRLFPGGRRLCWRPPPRCALFLRLATPTRPGNFLTRPGNFLTNWRIGVLENKKSRIVPTTIPQVFVKRSLFRKHLRSASYS